MAEISTVKILSSASLVFANVTCEATNITQNATAVVHTGANSHPGLAAVVALVGLGAVAFVVVRRH